MDAMQIFKRVWNTLCKQKNRRIIQLAGLILVALVLIGCRARQKGQANETAPDGTSIMFGADGTMFLLTEEEGPDYSAEAEAIARVLYGTARNNTPEQQWAVVWCILNRVENANYPDTVEEVCRQSQQWMGYSDDNPVLESLYELALKELNIWHSDVPRPMPTDYIFLYWTEDEVVLRDRFEERPGTKYWRV